MLIPSGLWANRWHGRRARRPQGWYGAPPAPPDCGRISHTLCHGDLGLWELLTALEPGRTAPLDGEILTSLEQRGPTGGLAREAFSPSLMAGLAGVVHTLLRMHPAADLPDPLLLDPRLAGRGMPG
ncbi:lanthionine synthetase LanC family protein [Streptomyces sp. DSM 15324]|uniref:lanthionine synthetase LanC family protein n=1 Tax=Streptomyces sp. DSM 15324 TaxID=1739111 RepID=UPI000AE65DC8|nr:lanthionine synthetase LanC family protein [Streptomyces sp. DSM 15324]